MSAANTDSVKWYALQLVARDLEGLASRLRRRSVDRMALAELCEDFARRLELAATEPGAVYCWRDDPTGFTACDRMAGHLGRHSWEKVEHEHLAEIIYEVLTTHVGTYTLPDVADIIAHRVEGLRPAAADSQPSVNRA